jgi:hypothetical protein
VYPRRLRALVGKALKQIHQAVARVVMRFHAEVEKLDRPVARTLNAGIGPYHF